MLRAPELLLRCETRPVRDDLVAVLAASLGAARARRRRMNRNEHLQTVRRIRDSVAARDVRGLLRELRAHMGDAMLAARALQPLCDLVASAETRADVALEAGGIDTALLALRTHGANASIAASALRMLVPTFTHAGEAVFEATAGNIATQAVAAMRRHSDNAAVLIRGSMALSEVCSGMSRMNAELWHSSASGVTQEAVRCLLAALRAHVGDFDITLQLMTALGDMFCVVVPENAVIGIESGCIELFATALRAHCGEAEKYEWFHTIGCHAIATTLWGATEFEVVDGCRSIFEPLLESLRRYPDSASVQYNGFKALQMYRMTGGRRIERDLAGVGRDVLQAGLVALRRHGPESGVPGKVFAVFSYDFDRNFGGEPRNNFHWMLPLLGTPENLALLKRSAEQLERQNECYPAIKSFVALMTHGACAGCNVLQETKMRQCSRCRRARYCSAECQQQHWPVHKRECVPAPAGAARS